MLHPLISRIPKHITIYQTRADYKAKTGKEAPPFDWSRPRKTWKDNREFTDPDEEILYTGIRYDSNGKPFELADQPGVVELRRFSLFPEVATSVNLLPEPMPPDSLLTESQRAMNRRQIPEPLALADGERVVVSRLLGGIVVDDGKSQSSPGPAEMAELLEKVRDIQAAVNRIAAKVGA